MLIAETVTAVLFDLDDTLVDHTSASCSGAVSLAAELGLDSPEEQWRRWLSIERRWFAKYENGTATQHSQRLGRAREFLGDDALSDAEAMEVYTRYRRAYRAHCRPFDDAAPTLQSVLDSGRTVGVFTNGAEAAQTAKLQSTGLDLPGVHLLSTEILGAPKPQPASYQAAAAHLGVDSGAGMLMIGDNFANDVAGARAAGWQAVYLLREGMSRDHRAPQAEEPVATLTELEF